jgi:hypothetical protein
MSLIVNIQVTKTPSHLEQIHNIVITNVGLVEPMVHGDTPYTVTIDGEMLDNIVYHNREDGALNLVSNALEEWRRDGTGT